MSEPEPSPPVPPPPPPLIVNSLTKPQRKFTDTKPKINQTALDRGALLQSIQQGKKLNISGRIINITHHEFNQRLNRTS